MQSIEAVELYMDAITRGFNFDNMIGAFISGICLFSIARIGGIPVANSCVGRLLWAFIFIIQFFEYLLILLSLVTNVLGYFHTRHHQYECLIKVKGSGFFQLFGLLDGVPIMDICVALTAMATPVSPSKAHV